eukprot:874067-Rhodomonas_salina.1
MPPLAPSFTPAPAAPAAPASMFFWERERPRGRSRACSFASSAWYQSARQYKSVWYQGTRQYSVWYQGTRPLVPRTSP